jgi:hypothetical protein
MADLTDELINGSQQPGQSIGQTLGPMVTNEIEDFIVSAMELMDTKGILDESMSGQKGLDDSADLADPNADPRELMSMEEIELLVSKFEKTPPDFQEQIMQAMRAENPALEQRIRAAIRLVRGGAQ